MATWLGLLAILFWGMLALLGALTQAVPPFLLLCICFTISAFIVVFRRLLLGQPVLFKPQLTSKQWLMGVIGLFGFHFCYFMALRYAPVLEVSLIVYLWPLLLALALAQAAQRSRALIGGILGFVGVLILIGTGQRLNLQTDFALGYALALCAAFIWAGYSWFLAKSKSRVEDIAWLSLLVALLSGLSHLLLESVDWKLSGLEWLGACLLGLGPVGGAFYLWDIGLKRGNASLLASLSYCAPLISAIALVLAGFQAWSSHIAVALGLIISGGVIANKKSQAKHESF